MPSTTPNRNYPFPLNPDRINVAGDIEALARAVDTDVAGVVTNGNNALQTEINNRTFQDGVLFNDYVRRDTEVTNYVRVALHAVYGDGSGRRDNFTQIMLDAGYSIIGLDAFAHGEQAFSTPFANPPIVIVNSAHADLWIVGTTGGNSSPAGTPIVSNTSFHIVAAQRNGASMANGVIVINWLAIGFSP